MATLTELNKNIKKMEKLNNMTNKKMNRLNDIFKDKFNKYDNTKLNSIDQTQNKLEHNLDNISKILTNLTNKLETMSIDPTKKMDEKTEKKLLRANKMTKTECGKINRTLDGLKLIVTEMDNFDNIQKYYDKKNLNV